MFDISIAKSPLFVKNIVERLRVRSQSYSAFNNTNVSGLTSCVLISLEFTVALDH